MLLILFWSSLWAWKQLSPPTTDDTRPPNTDGKLANGEAEQIFNPTSRSFVVCMSLIQAALGFVTLTTAHVQIITRLASGYPLWYWWLGTALVEKSNSQSWSRGAEWTVKWMVIYGSVQAGLFASFLPPA
jgi:GPI mannosyltransferase 2